MEITFLGTSSMIPTKDRNTLSVLLESEGDCILFDCSEGTQKQLRIAKINPSKINKILISHWHGDHVLGLPGLIQTLAASDYNKTLEIYGPVNSKKYMKKIMSICHFDKPISILVKEVKPNDKVKKFYQSSGYSISAIDLRHSVPCLAFLFKEEDKRKINLEYIKAKGMPRKSPLLGLLQKGKDIEFKGKKILAEKATNLVKGKSISFITDTKLHKNCIKIAKNSDILICESTYLSDLESKAEQYKHLTAKQAALIARDSFVKTLLLTHFSQRYKDVTVLEDEAKLVFENSLSTKDFMRIKI